MNSTVIVAGGTGFRIKGDTPKQFIKLNGEEILSFSVTTFLNHPQIEEVVIVCHPDWIEHVKSKYPECCVTTGGERRQDSSLNGVNTTSHEAEIVLIHDAARPFISEEIITDCLAALKNAEGSAPILDSPNSLVKWDEKKAFRINRSEIKIVQTPQCFRKELILKALSAGIEGTDEIGMMLETFPDSFLKFVMGDKYNLKITTEMDLFTAQKIRNKIQAL